MPYCEEVSMPQTFAMTNNVEQIVNSIRSLQSQDAFIEEQVKVTGRTAGWWWAGLVASIILTFISLNNAPSLVVVTLPAALLCLIMGIIWSSRNAKCKKQDRENRRIELARTFFEVIGHDVPRRNQCAVSISFDDYRIHGQLVEKQKAGFFGSIRTFKYRDSWFSARGLLYDGNRFRLTIDQTIHRKEKAKRKYTKINERIEEQITLVLKVSAETYPNLPQLQLTPGKFNGLHITRTDVRNGMVRVRCETPQATTVKGRSGTQAWGYDNLADGATLLKLFVFVYSKLQDCRAAQAAPG